MRTENVSLPAGTAILTVHSIAPPAASEQPLVPVAKSMVTGATADFGAAPFTATKLTWTDCIDRLPPRGAGGTVIENEALPSVFDAAPTGTTSFDPPPWQDASIMEISEAASSASLLIWEAYHATFAGR